jgi:hypothetical protein
MEHELEQKRFLWGMALAWAPRVPSPSLMISLASAFRGMPHPKAMGVWAVAGGFAGMYISMAGLLR